MTKMLVAMTLALGVLAAPAFAGETTVTLAVRNWYCAACPHVVKESLAAVPGVTNVAVSDKTKTAVVTFDDTKADVRRSLRQRPKRAIPRSLIRKGCYGHERPRAHYFRRCRGRVGRDLLCGPASGRGAGSIRSYGVARQRCLCR